MRLQFALAALLASVSVDAAPPAVRHVRFVEQAPPRALASGDTTMSGASTLPAISIRNRNTNASASIRLYGAGSAIDRAALQSFMRVASSAPNLPDRASGEPAEPLDPRLVQLAFRASYHFGGAPIILVSATRRGAHGKHGKGAALDFQLEGVRAATLAAYVRGFPRAGVGIYTHPKTQYVHVDVRDRSYHWIDGSPPGVSWREKLLADPTQAKRDAGYVPAMDLPERD